jgi:hypothetical protein
VSFTVRRESDLPPQSAFAALSDLAAHGAFVPLTDVSVVDAQLAVGGEVRAVTRLGPLRLTDRMRVTVLDPGRRLRLVKTGWVLDGWADIRVTERPGGGSIVEWTEELWLPGLGPTRYLGDLLGPSLFGPTVDGLLAGARSE